MKIVEDSPERLTLKEGALATRIFGVVFVLLGIGVAVAGTQANKNGTTLLAVGAIFAVVGLIILLSSKSAVITADKAAKQLSVAYSSLLNRAGKNQAAAFSDVVSVELTQQYVRNTASTSNNTGSGISFGTGGVGVGSSNMNIEYNLAVQLKSGDAWTVASEQRQMNLSLGVGHNSLVGLGQKLADTLGVPFNQAGPPSPGQVIGEVIDHLRGKSDEIKN